jgi:hypothetical protein
VIRDTPAETILKRLGITDPREIDLEAIAWHLGAHIRYRPLEHCEARIVGHADRAVITVNSRSGRRRKRFSIGHELGHWHHDRGRLLFCQAADIGRAADRFASNLLMPEYLCEPIHGSISTPLGRLPTHSIPAGPRRRFGWWKAGISSAA